MKSNWSKPELQRMLKNAKRRYSYWNQGCKRTSSKAHEKLELCRNDIENLENLLTDYP